MRINGPGRAGSPATQGKGRAAGSAGGFRLDAPREASSAAPARGMGAIGGVDALLALQMVEDPLARRKKAAKRGNDMLDLLDQIKLDILGGSVPRGKLEHLLKVVRERGEGLPDARLQGVLDEIELRARVELAKLGLPDT